MKILKILEIDKNGRALIHSHSNIELVEAIKEIYQLIEKDKAKDCEACLKQVSIAIDLAENRSKH